MDDAEASNPPKRKSEESERGEIEFDSALFRRRSAPKIPANGSELFDESDGEEAEIYEEDYEEEVYETRKPIYSHRNTHEFDEAEAEKRYRQREARLRKKAEKRRQNRHLGGKILAILQFILSVVFMGLIFKLDVLPTKYFIAASIILILLALICFLLQFRKHAHWAGKIISFIVILIMIFGSVYVAKTIYTLNSVTKVKAYQTDKIVIGVLADDPAESLGDAKDYKFGIMAGNDRSKVDLAITQMNNSLDSEIDTVEYNSYSEQVQALYDGKIDAMIYNQALDELIEEKNPGFLEKVRIIDNFNVETEVYMEDIPDLPITKEPFVVFLSGMDVYGELEQTSRSDVNIMACVNPTTKQVLLVSVPRDAYVEIPGITYGEKDKLTHAGMYGIQYSIASMEEIFDLDIRYYVRINFTSLIMMVDALGGIDVESDYAFSTYYKQYDADTDTWSYYEYDRGMNHLDGVHALAFARERMNAAGGDYQRAKNQQKVIAALLEKIKSPAFLTGYTGLLSSLEGKMDTNFTSQQLASLVKMQLNDGADWNIVSSSVYGISSQEYCASYAGAPLDVEVLDDDSIDAVKEVIDKLMKGQVISEPRATDIQEAYEVNGSDADDDYYVNNHADDDEYDDFYWEHGGYLGEEDSETFEYSEDEEY
ncbi:LCP family protein [Frisingicoccus caecimuris]|nr:LCP family protein [Frisingicoccus caecimuris]MCR1918803.1 LCP family protein [Frisingicoccus caecimuris]